MIKLRKANAFALTEHSKDKVDRAIATGTWNITQLPYIELEADRSHYFFEIKQYQSSDQVSKIDFIELFPLNSGELPLHCSYLHGTRPGS